MELTIKNSIYTLRSVNLARRECFVVDVLSYYDYKSKDFDSFIKDTQAELQKNHKIKMNLDKVKSSFLVQYQKKICHCIWEFLSSQDKKDFSSRDNLEISHQDLRRFIEWGSDKIKKYADYVKNNNKKNDSEDLIFIYSYLSRTYGWTLDYIKEMDELELFKAIEAAVDINQKESLNAINSQALVGAYTSGSKQAKSQIDRLNRREKTRDYQKSNPDLEIKNELTREQLQKIMDQDKEAKNG